MSTLKDRIQQALDAGHTVGALAAAAGKTPGAASLWKTGRTLSLDGESAAGLAALTGWSAVWWAKGLGPRELRFPDKSVAQRLIPEPLTVELQLLEWRALMDGDIPERFATVLVDEAMAPAIPAGVRVEFERVASDFKPQFGQHVLLVDKAGAFHFRKFSQAPGGSWVGAATRSGFLDIQPERDGARVVARMTGRYIPGDLDA